MSEPPLRIYLAGKVCLERGSLLIPERRFPGPQGRLVFAMLAVEHERAVTHEEIADELWGERATRAWDTALRAIVSRLRTVVGDAGLDASKSIESAFGCYQLRLPTDAWIDLEAAADAVHRAESALRAGRPREANGWALVACSVTRRPFLPGQEGPWASRRRAALRDIRVRALECRAEILIGKGDHALAARDAEEVLDLEPFRETGYQLLMRAHAGGGNPAEALRAFERCRALLADELGASPSPDTETLYLEILRAG
ncbi:MAG: AfsR/SARP family transcriptional regulator [Actinomycetota bacterium]